MRRTRCAPRRRPRPRIAADARPGVRVRRRCRRCWRSSRHTNACRPPTRPGTGRIFARAAAVLAALESLRDAHQRHDDAPLPLAELLNTVRRWIEGADVLAAHRHQRADPARRPGRRLRRSSTRCDWRASSTPTGPTAAAAASSIRRRCSRSSAGPPTPTVSRPRAPGFKICCGWRGRGSRSRPSRSRTTRSCPRRRSSKRWNGRPAARVSAAPTARVSCTKRSRKNPSPPTALSGVPLEWLSLRASRSPGSGGDVPRRGRRARGGRVRGQPASSAISNVRSSTLPRYVLAPSGRARRGIGTDAAGARTVPARGLRSVLRGVAGVGAASHHDRERRGRARALRARRRDAAANRCRSRTARSSARTCWARPPLPALRSARSRSKSSRAARSSSGCSSTSSKARSCSATDAGPRTVRLRAKADRIDLLDDGTLRVVDYKLGKAPKPARALQLPVYGVCAAASLDGRHGRSWTLGRAGYVAFREKNAFVALGGSSSLDEAVAGRAGSACSAPSTPSSGASSRRSRTSRSSARAAATPPSAGRTTSAMSERLDRPRRVAPAVAVRLGDGVASRFRPSIVEPARADRSRRERARVRRRSPQQRRARGVGRHRQDVGARVALHQPAEGGRRARQHPGDHVHAQGRGRDARAHRPRAAGRGGAVGVRQGALDRAARSARRDRHQHDRRVLPVAAARVPARSGPRSRVRDGRRDRSAAARRGVARSVAAHLRRPGASTSRTWRSCWRSSASSRTREGLALAARAPAGRVGRARSVPGARPGRPDGGDRLPARGDRAAGRAARGAGRPRPVPRRRPGRSPALPAARARARAAGRVSSAPATREIRGAARSRRGRTS